MSVVVWSSIRLINWYSWADRWPWEIVPTANAYSCGTEQFVTPHLLLSESDMPDLLTLINSFDADEQHMSLGQPPKQQLVSISYANLRAQLTKPPCFTIIFASNVAYIWTNIPLWIIRTQRFHAMKCLPNHFLRSFSSAFMKSLMDAYLGNPFQKWLKHKPNVTALFLCPCLHISFTESKLVNNLSGSILVLSVWHLFNIYFPGTTPPLPWRNCPSLFLLVLA